MRTRVPSTRQFRLFWAICSPSADAALMPTLYPMSGKRPVSRMPTQRLQSPFLHPHVIGERTTISSTFVVLILSRTGLVMTVPGLKPATSSCSTEPMLSSSETSTGSPAVVPQSSSVTTCSIAAEFMALLR